MTRIKICGITRMEDARAAALFGADALGFNFSPESPRCVTKDAARTMVCALPPFIEGVGVFVEQDPREIIEICRYCGLSVAQLHGSRYSEEETKLVLEGVRVLKVFRPETDFTPAAVLRFREATGVSAFLFDTYRPGMEGGTGEQMEGSLAERIFSGLPEGCYGVLAGGLNPGNVREAVQSLRPYALDTASGVEESPGIKSHEKMQAFVQAVRAAGER
ncbi:phosphoribosylanthranilate isomerase [Pelodictyon luteolum]|uniref:N-(5'-phosphoribosyl)anthranilate isomerase n=1 Tax=Chlorobium luteolum (strain DSM 273 / BCRC 81028 / 2530) TaxID=319225 RepID=TRPF_CHLL3|nr:phosphoribosylanthranilate isomerase [Pelodictyon luteolum]Q3B533.1 RecName: Full=N-(5'-phosphoribosyl)anthranilate isomerase; Short=PRAI [Pelodictyon luteolum DSM 273]ABB23548.1 phosphoribosylanthranilate isomerase [Pelodictyon luteolum DSM 273]